MLDEKIMEYVKMFDNSFPMIPLAWGRSDEEVVEIIDDCLKHKKDVYKMGYLKEEDGIKY